MFNYILNKLSNWAENKKPTKTPQTLEEAIDYTVYLMQIKDLTQDEVQILIRSNFMLWNKNSILHKHMKTRFGLINACDTSEIIFMAAKAKIYGINFNLQKDVERIKSRK